MGTGLGAGLMEIATGLLAIALVALLINKADNTTKVIESGTSGFNKLLQTVTLQNGSGLGGFSF